MRAMLSRLSQFDLHHRIAADPAPTLVCFTAPACGACRRMLQVLEAVAERRPEWRIHTVDAVDESALVNEFEVFHLPALFLFHEGRFHRPLSCEATPAAVERAVEAALRLPAEEAP